MENIFGFQIVQPGNSPYTDRQVSKMLFAYLFIYFFCFFLVALYLNFIPPHPKKQGYLLSLLHIFVKLIKNY